MNYLKINEPINREPLNGRSWMNRYTLHSYWKEIAKRTTICKVCDNEIYQDDIRMAIIENDRYSGRRLLYFHWNCGIKFVSEMNKNKLPKTPRQKLNIYKASLDENIKIEAPDFIINDLKVKVRYWELRTKGKTNKEAKEDNINIISIVDGFSLKKEIDEKIINNL